MHQCRVYLPLGPAGVRTLHEEKGVRVAEGFAVTTALERAHPGEDEEGLEYLALQEALAAALAGREKPSALAVVAAADVPSDRSTCARRSPPRRSRGSCCATPSRSPRSWPSTSRSRRPGPATSPTCCGTTSPSSPRCSGSPPAAADRRRPALRTASLVGQPAAAHLEVLRPRDHEPPADGTARQAATSPPSRSSIRARSRSSTSGWGRTRPSCPTSEASSSERSTSWRSRAAEPLGALPLGEGARVRRPEEPADVAARRDLPVDAERQPADLLDREVDQVVGEVGAPGPGRTTTSAPTSYLPPRVAPIR